MKMNKITNKADADKEISDAMAEYQRADAAIKRNPTPPEKWNRKLAELVIVASGGQLEQAEYPSPFALARLKPEVLELWQEKRDRAQDVYDTVMAAFEKSLIS